MSDAGKPPDLRRAILWFAAVEAVGIAALVLWLVLRD